MRKKNYYINSVGGEITKERNGVGYFITRGIFRAWRVSRLVKKGKYEKVVEIANKGLR